MPLMMIVGVNSRHVYSGGVGLLTPDEVHAHIIRQNR